MLGSKDQSAGAVGSGREAAARETDGGKRIGDAVYMHACLLERQRPAVRGLVEDAERAAGVMRDTFNVVRISRASPEVALLAYPGFFSEAFPALRFSWLVDLESGRAARRDFEPQANPPILHRKELLLPEDHPDRAKFAGLTAALEDYGAFDGAVRQIGRRSYWDDTLLRLGLRIEDHEVIAAADPARRDSPEPRSIARHRTAISRSRLSTSMRALERAGFLDPPSIVLDYGCGRGDDVRLLRAAGIPAVGWDPHYAPDVPFEPADVVNLGFVLNVIEDPAERREALWRAFGLARRVLAVAVMTDGGRGGTGYGDGVVTNHRTFQRYFAQAELREYVARTLGRDPVSVGPGLVFVFRGDEDEQAFLARRQRSAPGAALEHAEEVSSPRTRRVRRPSAYERHQESLDAFWCEALELGRLPEPDECAAAREAAAALGSIRRAYAALPFDGKEAELTRAASRRADDLLVYLALNLFERRRSADALPPSVVRDLRRFFGGRRPASERAQAALFGSGDADAVSAAAARAAAAGSGALDTTDGDYLFSLASLAEQPPEVRIIVGCAEQLEPLPPEVDLLKVHGGGRRVSYLRFDGFAERQLPVLAARTVVDLRRQRVEERRVDEPDGRRVLLGKARFMSPDDPGRDRQERFDALLRSRGLLGVAGLGPGVRAFAQRLRAAGIGTQPRGPGPAAPERRPVAGAP